MSQEDKNRPGTSNEMTPQEAVQALQVRGPFLQALLEGGVRSRMEVLFCHGQPHQLGGGAQP